MKFRQYSGESSSYVDQFLGSDWEEIPATLVQFLSWAFADVIRTYRPRYGSALIWTAPRYIAEYEAAAERFERIHAAIQLGHTKWMPRWKRRDRKGADHDRT